VGTGVGGGFNGTGVAPGVGGGLIALGVSREKRRTRLVATAVQRYNKAVLSEEEPED
jgi:hypothetical protein